MHFIEGYSEQIEKYLQRLNKLKENDKKITSAKILVYNEKYNRKIFKFWGSVKSSFPLSLDLNVEKTDKEV